MGNTVRGKINGLQPSYGFIRADSGEDLFFLPAHVLPPVSFGALKLEQKVECERIPGREPGKWRAVNVKVVE